ncbi:MAG: TonB-dependent receptor [Ignavibacteriae bacterium]|nr:TonB-dependent receptor [Ignavibacteriota bacterium]
MTPLRLFFFLLLLAPLAATAGPTGKIAGKVTDAKTGEGVPGVNIVIVGTTLGAATNLDGDYTILNVPPGTYELRASSIGYAPVLTKNVKVNIDLTARINIQIGESVVELKDEVVVTAERPTVQRDLTASTAVVGSDEIDALPVTEVSEVLSLQAGYVDGHLRGGRQGEISYWIDGVPVTDVYDGGTVVEVNKNQVQELQMVSGAFNAEYGQALSGIVNIATKDGDNRFRGSLGSYIGDYATSNTSIFRGLEKFDPVAIRNFEGSLSGPVLSDRVFFMLNARAIKFGGWLKGYNVFTPNNIALIDSAGNFIRNRDGAAGRGDGSVVEMNGSEKFYAQGKLSFRVFEGVKLWYQYIHDDVTYKDFNSFYVLNPMGAPTNHRLGQTHLAQATHVLSNSTFYTVGLSLFKKDFRSYVYEDMNDPRYVHPNLLLQVTPYSFSTGGTDMRHFQRTTTTLVGKADFTSQITQQHLVKGGLQFSSHELAYDDITLRPAADQTEINLLTDSPYIRTRVLDVSTIYHDQYTRTPREYAAYVQDKMEFDNLIINLGVRFDYFDPAGQILSDPSDPSIYNPIKPSNRFHDTNNNGVQDANETEVTLAERQAYWYTNTTAKWQFSPRFGAAFPITDRGVLHFSYGHFFQIPRFEYLYTNPFFKLGTGTGNQGTVGNADLKPERTVNAEIGLQQQLSDDISMDVTAYIRDTRDLAGTRAEQITIFGGSATYSRIVNSDFAFTRGIVLSLQKRFMDGLAATLDYTFQIARGTSSDPYSAQQAAARGDLPEVQLTPLGWDQRHTINGTVSYNASSYGGSLIFQYGSGQPYTPRRAEDITSLIVNSQTKPSSLNADLRLYKNFGLGFATLNLFLRIFNLFDTLNEMDVFDDTGRAGYTTDLERIKQQNTPEYVNTIDEYFNRSTYYSEPRRIEIGATIEF